MAKEISYHIEQWIPRRPSWIPGSNKILPGYYRSTFIVTGQGAKKRALHDAKRYHYDRRGKPWRVVRHTREVVT